jgi:hypothetical protein
MRYEVKEKEKEIAEWKEIIKPIDFLKLHMRYANEEEERNS